MNYDNAWPETWTDEAIEKVMAENPDLFRQKPDLRHFKMACEFLSARDEIGSMNYTKGSSFYLTIYLQRYTKEAITNDAVVAAALHLGLKHEVIDGNYEVAFNISSRNWPKIHGRRLAPLV